jgi:hypothetical protein
VLGLKGIEIDWRGWLAALSGAVGTLVLCEVSKLVRQAMALHNKGRSTDAQASKGVSKGEVKNGVAKKTSAQNMV